MKKDNPISGLLVVDKPAGPTSHDIVARTRRELGTRRVGHAGTLDPMATGVLVLGVGRATKLLTYIVGSDKEYEATIRLGIGTVTDDAEGEITGTPGFVLQDASTLEQAIEKFRGAIMQVPSSVSAIKIDGKRSYSRVRAGEEVKLEARPIQISAYEILGDPRIIEEPVRGIDIDVRVECSSGTYIRALARDLGKSLGTEGHLTALRRTRVGPFRISEAGNQLLNIEDACIMLYPLKFEVDEVSSQRFSHGVVLDIDGFAAGSESKIASLTHNGQVLGLVRVERGRLKPAFIIKPS